MAQGHTYSFDNPQALTECVRSHCRRLGDSRKPNTLETQEWIDDLTQWTMLALWKQECRARTALGVTDNSSVKSWGDGQVHQIISGMAARTLDLQTENKLGDDPMKVPGARIAGRKFFTRKRSAIEHVKGRSLTKAEQDELAREIRATWHDPKHRPPVDFHVSATIVYLDAEDNPLQLVDAPAVVDDHIVAEPESPGSLWALLVPGIEFTNDLTEREVQCYFDFLLGACLEREVARHNPFVLTPFVVSHLDDDVFSILENHISYAADLLTYAITCAADLSGVTPIAIPVTA